MNMLKATVLLLLVALLGAAAFVFSGIYNIAADSRHLRPTLALIETFRDRSITAHARGVIPPPLDEPALIAEGAAHYETMCSNCHLAPNKTTSEIRTGLYPQPPDFRVPGNRSPSETFWVIKHGIKLTAMPAWGLTHDDAAIWGLVAFLRKLPQLSPDQYAQLTLHSSDHSDHLDAAHSERHE